MAYLRNNWKLVLGFALYASAVLCSPALVPSILINSSLAQTTWLFCAMSGLILWPWLLIKPSTLRSRIRSQGPVVLYLLGFVLVAALKLETIGTVYAGIGCVWLVVYLIRNADGTHVSKDPYTDSRGLYGDVSPEPIFRGS